MSSLPSNSYFKTVFSEAMKLFQDLTDINRSGSNDRKENQEVNRNDQVTIVLSLAMIQPNNLRIRVQAINDTWGERCTKLLFHSSRSDRVLPALGFDTPEGLMYINLLI